VSRGLDAEGLRLMHLRKTAALIQAAVVAGGIVAGADAEERLALQAYGFEVGLAFQIVDDVLDVEGTEAALGKTAGKDAAGGKPTYPSVHGVEESRRLARECIARAIEAIEGAKLGASLAGIARVVIDRQH
jgi:geranylgeranyl pyrophosphate synthase